MQTEISKQNISHFLNSIIKGQEKIFQKYQPLDELKMYGKVR